eukprot:TRINITY_DN5981_c0_g1_i11.p1 TRINITY_DN5981_c0_g1~~TRINITY_DN5981_c0_g1_i11.p1  ORF type:complete len:180 (-),score=47.87 TRINITY_DN5981_c0_g1_i11:61-600(-)
MVNEEVAKNYQERSSTKKREKRRLNARARNARRRQNDGEDEDDDEDRDDDRESDWLQRRGPRRKEQTYENTCNMLEKLNVFFFENNAEKNALKNPFRTIKEEDSMEEIIKKLGGTQRALAMYHTCSYFIPLINLGLDALTTKMGITKKTEHLNNRSDIKKEIDKLSKAVTRLSRKFNSV